MMGIRAQGGRIEHRLDATLSTREDAECTFFRGIHLLLCDYSMVTLWVRIRLTCRAADLDNAKARSDQISHS
jgi:hypothetical protein